MRILHISEHSAVEGGREAHIRRFCAMSDALGHQNVVLHDGEPSQVREAMSGAAACQSATSSPPDIVLLHTRRSWSLARSFSEIAPTYAWVHDHAFVCPASISWYRNTQEPCSLRPGLHCMANAYVKWCNARRPDRNLMSYLSVVRSLSGVPYLSGIVVASAYMKNRLAVSGVPDDLIHVLPYFVTADVDEPFSTVPEIPNRILFVGRLSEVKGVEVVLDALSLLPGAVEFAIVGEGYHRPAIEAHLSKLPLCEKRIRFLGPVTDAAKLAEIYRSAALLVVPSLWPEPFGIVGLEALWHGRPVVAFGVGGIPEWLADGEVGLLARPGDARDLAAKLHRLLQDSDYRHTLGRRGAEYVRRSFSWESHWQRFLEILRQTGLAV